MDVETASAGIDALIERRSKERERADELEALWRASERKDREKRRRDNREAWHAFHCHLQELHSAIAEEHRSKAEQLLDEPEVSSG